jgi:DNA-binding MarR family transcriptional regulator
MDGEPQVSLGPISVAIFRLARAHRLLAAQLLREVGLHPGQELVMLHLWETGPQRQTALASAFDLDSASATRTVQRLERAGYVCRYPDPTDGRATLVTPTQASFALRARVEQIWVDLEHRTIAGLTPDEQAKALAVLRRLESNALPPPG